MVDGLPPDGPPPDGPPPDVSPPSVSSFCSPNVFDVNWSLFVRIKTSPAVLSTSQL